MYEFRKRIKIVDAVKNICDAFGEAVFKRIKDDTQTLNAIILSSRFHLNDLRQLMMIQFVQYLLQIHEF